MTFAALGTSVVSPATDAELGIGLGLRRSRSEPLLRCSFRVSRLAAASHGLKASRSIGAFPLGISGSILPSSIRSLIFEPEDVGLFDAEESEEEIAAGFQDENLSKKKANWVQRICEIRSRWKDFRQRNGRGEAEGVKWEDDDNGCGVSYESEEEQKEWDREEFSGLLNKASWAETKLFGQLAFLCNIAYFIPEIKDDELRRYHGLRLVTSSLDKKQEIAIKASLDSDSTSAAWPERAPPSSSQQAARSSSVAFEIAATAASYIHDKAKSLLYRGSQATDENEIAADFQSGGNCRTYKSKMATYVAASSVTAVVAAEEKARLEAARELQSLHSSPCEWFVCDEPSTCTRCFVIQGSDSLASWQANLFFEPTKFEETEALVHRGIYEAAKGIYLKLLPDIQSHLLTHGPNARFRFTGHSLGGSLSLLISLMLLSRRAIPLPSLLPIVTFGSPAVLCSGHLALHSLRLDQTHILAVMMHRDIVPRAFSCDYPSHVVKLLGRLNTSFRAHTCLNADKLLYFPLGKQYILQPDDEFSPPHPWLPSGAALYVLDCDGDGRRGALRRFLNTPHPLETLSHLKAYGSDGTILRDHDSGNYLVALNGLLRRRTRVRSRRRRWSQWCPPESLPVHAWVKHESQVGKEIASGA
ncbi:uncharacterized protein LOC110027531 [Phalaenopsis equestris]|uniref:uncharacterized protein LOC110027531 n=1 Tax=Phalaenopsis equestris TaxID=78828 RepID=UPI0009E215BD|nr:uncharacterized protein LOC110027531 [Phalaenopsis equestris]